MKVSYKDHKPFIRDLASLAMKKVNDLCEAKYPTLDFAMSDDLIDDAPLSPGKSAVSSDVIKQLRDEIAQPVALCLITFLMQTFFRIKNPGFARKMNGGSL